jgi:hypothetical protein
MRLRYIIDDSLLDITKTIFAFSLEVFTNGAAQSLFNHLIRIQRTQTQSSSKLPPNG